MKCNHLLISLLQSFDIVDLNNEGTPLFCRKCQKYFLIRYTIKTQVSMVSVTMASFESSNISEVKWICISLFTLKGIHNIKELSIFPCAWHIITEIQKFHSELECFFPQMKQVCILSMNLTKIELFLDSCECRTIHAVVSYRRIFITTKYLKSKLILTIENTCAQMFKLKTENKIRNWYLFESSIGG